MAKSSESPKLALPATATAPGMPNAPVEPNPFLEPQTFKALSNECAKVALLGAEQLSVENEK